MADWNAETVANCLVHLSLGTLTKLQKRDYKPVGRYPIIDQGQSFIAGWTDDDSGLISNNLPVIVFGDHTRALKFVDFPFVRGADGTQVLKPRDGIDALFFYYACQSIDLPARGYNRHFTVLKDKLLPIPPPHEQFQIGMILRRVDESLQVQTDLLNVMAIMKRAAMRRLFTCGLRGEAQKETEIGLIPESWELTPAEQIFKLTSGKTRPDNLVSEATLEKPYPVLGGNGTMGYSSEWNSESDEMLVIGRVGEYCGAVHVASGKVWITDNALYAKDWLNQPVNIGYVAAFLHYFDLNRFKRMAGQPLVTQGMINEHSIPLPSPDEQREIVEILDAIDRKIGLHQRKRAVLQDLIKALLHRLMTGKIRVADLDLSVLGEGPLEGVAA